MSVKVIFMGRPTKDPVMSQSQNGTEYISLDVAVSQRGQTGNDETVFYQQRTRRSTCESKSQKRLLHFHRRFA